MKKNTALVVRGGVIAALYAGLTLISSALGLSFGPIQFRFSEALCVLPVFFPEAIPALTIGCLISNLASPFGLADIVFGTAATLLSCLVSAWFKNVKVFKLPLLSLLSPVIFNAIIVGAEISLLSGGSALLFATYALEVGAGELGVMAVLGVPLYFWLNKRLTKRV